jgi:hypothetical protein
LMYLLSKQLLNNFLDIKSLKFIYSNNWFLVFYEIIDK